RASGAGRRATRPASRWPSSRSSREPREVGRALLRERIAPLLRLGGHVVQERRVAGELLRAGEAVDARVVAGLQQAERQRRLLEQFPGPREGRGLELVERHDGVHEPPPERRLGVVLPAQEPDLLRALLSDLPGQQADPVAAVERADARTGLAEAG